MKFRFKRVCQGRFAESEFGGVASYRKSLGAHFPLSHKGRGEKRSRPGMTGCFEQILMTGMMADMREVAALAARRFRLGGHRSLGVLGELGGGDPALGKVFPGRPGIPVAARPRHSVALGGVTAKFSRRNHFRPLFIPPRAKNAKRGIFVPDSRKEHWGNSCQMRTNRVHSPCSVLI